MRIGVLEWVSCAGCGEAAGFDDSVRREGWAMCRAALQSLAYAGHRPVAAVNPWLIHDQQLAQLRSQGLELIDPLAAPIQHLCKEVYATCDATLVIAPESDGILADTLKWCDKYGVRTCNANGEFLARAGDKLATAFHLDRQQIPHPPTRSLAASTTRWMRETSNRTSQCQQVSWVVKQRSGVGCDGMQRMTSTRLQQFRRQARTSSSRKGWIVQPWLGGKSFSRAAIFDSQGNPHWLPVTRQNITVTDHRVSYSGGAVEPELAAQMDGLDELLGRTVAALGSGRRGWVGVDFLYDAANADRPLTIIEINPRLTTSFVGLCQAGAPGLAWSIVAACLGQSFELPGRWQSVEFAADGEILARV